MKKSPLAPKIFPDMPKIKGVNLSTLEAGIKYKNRTDLLLAELSEGTIVAGCFTKSKTASANILWAKRAIKNHKARILIVNSGNANAFNGKAGDDSVERIIDESVKIWGCAENEVYPCATGVIGEPLPDRKITSSLAHMKDNLSDDIWLDAAKAIMTTDTFAKIATRKAKIGDENVTINGIAKGSGMIAPDMATMLSYIFTDAKIDGEKLQEILKQSVDKSFNSITVDSDTSTSDTVLLFATGKANNSLDDDLSDFIKKLDEITLDLAHQIIKDGEGATKFIEIEVIRAENDYASKKIGLAIANSPLVKTAIAGEDANWGRIVMAVGKSGEEANRDYMSISIGDISIVKNGQLDSSYNEDDVTDHMKGDNIKITVDVGVKNGSAKVWTCDLTHEYISINADYRS